MKTLKASNKRYKQMPKIKSQKRKGGTLGIDAQNINDIDPFVCPISQHVLVDPVIAEDGYAYEKSYIQSWLRTKKTSPMSRKPMSPIVYPCIPLKNMIAVLVETNQDFREQYEEAKLNTVRSTPQVAFTDDSIRNAVNSFIKSPDYTIQQYGNIEQWNVSNVTDMSQLFDGASNFNEDIGAWNVSNVKSMKQMFEGASNFNKDIGAWNVSNVTDMSGMFVIAEAFNQDIGAWNVSNVTNMAHMFDGAAIFNKDIGAWDVSKVKNMRGMFRFNVAFNQDIGAWNVSNVKNMEQMFFSTTEFNQDIGAWNVSNVKSMKQMFEDAEAFNHDSPRTMADN